MKKLLLFSLMVFAISSCKEKEQSPEPVVSSEKLTSKDVTMENGVLRFASKEHLMNVTKEISQNKEMENWYSNPAFVSLLKRQKSISKQEYEKIGETGEFGKLSDVLIFKGEGDDKYLKKIVEVSELSAVLNSNSYVIVSDSAYHVGADHVTSIYIGDNLSKLSDFLRDSYTQGSHHVEIGRVSLSNARTQAEFQQTRGNRRIRGTNEITSFGGLGAYRDVYVEYFKKNWIGWSPTEAPYLSVTVTASSAPYGGVAYLPYKVEGWNVEGVGLRTQDASFGSQVYYNFKARMVCTIFNNENFETDF